MANSRARILILFGCGCACGCGPDIVSNSETGADETPYSAETQASGWGEDDDDQPGSGCIVDGELRRPLWLAGALDERLLLYPSDGGVVELPVPEHETWIGVDVSATHVAAAYRGDNDGFVRLFARESHELIWERRYLESRLGDPFLLDDGRVLLGYFDDFSMALGFHGGLLLGGAEDVELPWVYPIEQVGAHGFAPALFLDPADQSLSERKLTGWGWVEPESNAKVILEDELALRPSYMLVEGDAFEYVDGDPEAGARLLWAAFEGSHWVPLPVADGIWVAAHNDRHRLLQLSSADSTLVRLSIADGELLGFDRPPPPSGQQFFGCDDDLTIDSLGRVLYAVRDESAARVAAWDPETQQWSFVGLPMIDLLDVHFGQVFGEFVAVSGSDDEHNCSEPIDPEDPGAPFIDPPADALVGDSRQLIGVESGTVVQNRGAVDVDPQRVCATWITTDARIIHDLEDGDELALPFSTHHGWFDD